MTHIPRSATGRTALGVAREAASLAGEILVRRFDQVKQVAFKGRGNVVTDVDTEVEAAAVSLPASRVPGNGLPRRGDGR